MNSPEFLSVIFAITLIAVCYSCTVINCIELKLYFKNVLVLMQMSFFTISKTCNKCMCYKIIIILALLVFMDKLARHLVLEDCVIE